MAKDTNTSKCPEMVSGCKSAENYGSTISLTKYLTSDGFKLVFDVSLIGFLLDKSEISSIGSQVSSCLKGKINSLIADFLYDYSQMDLPF